MKLLRLIVIAMCFAGVTEAHAQSAIESAVKELGDNVNKIYTEKRNPETKKIFMVSEVITIPDEKLPLIKNAIEKERPNATEYSIFGPDQVNITFRNDNKKKVTYTLVGNTLSMAARYFDE